MLRDGPSQFLGFVGDVIGGLKLMVPNCLGKLLQSVQEKIKQSLASESVRAHFAPAFALISASAISFEAKKSGIEPVDFS